MTTKEFDINGRTYQIDGLTWGEMRKVTRTVSRLATKYLAVFSETLSGEDGLNLAVGFGAVVATVLAECDSPEIESLAESFGKVTSVHGVCASMNADKRDLHFAEHPEDFYPWLVRGIEVNCLPLLRGLTSLIPRKEGGKVDAKAAAEALAGLTSKGS